MPRHVTGPEGGGNGKRAGGAGDWRWARRRNGVRPPGRPQSPARTPRPCGLEGRRPRGSWSLRWWVQFGGAQRQRSGADLRGELAVRTEAVVVTELVIGSTAAP